MYKQTYTNSLQGNPKDTKQIAFQKRISQILGIDESSIPKILKNRPFMALRHNPLSKTSKETLLRILRTNDIYVWPLSWYRDAFIFDSSDTQKIQSCLKDLADAYLIQNPSSYIPVFALQPEAGEKILDMCASPGAKTSLIWELTRGSVELHVNEMKSKRIVKLESLLQSHNMMDRVHITHFDGKMMRPSDVGYFDKILVDADCSGEAGINLRSHSSLDNWSLATINKMSDIQKKLLRSAFELLNDGGRVVYSTCTFAPEENEEVIRDLLESYPNANIIPITFNSEKTRRPLKSWDAVDYPQNIGGAIRIAPSDYMEGFFVCAVSKGPSMPLSINIDEIANGY